MRYRRRPATRIFHLKTRLTTRLTRRNFPFTRRGLSTQRLIKLFLFCLVFCVFYVVNFWFFFFFSTILVWLHIAAVTQFLIVFFRQLGTVIWVLVYYVWFFFFFLCHVIGFLSKRCVLTVNINIYLSIYAIRCLCFI